MSFAAYPSAVIYNKPGKKLAINAVQHLLWGDWLERLEPVNGEWVKVRWRGVTGWMHQDDIQEERLLEVNFVDIGQGDGCFIVTPEDRSIIIDAGEGDNMYRFLRWRYGGFKNKFKFESAIITHPDKDHYGGFEPLFKAQNVHFGTIFHNGIVERTGKYLLGPRAKKGSASYLTDVINDREALDKIIKDPTKTGNLLYPNLLKFASDTMRVEDIKMLSCDDGFLPGYGEDKNISIWILGPLPTKDANGKSMLRWYGTDGKTKNGNSIILRLSYDKFSLLLGGDLNVLSEKDILKHYTNMDPEPKNEADEEKLILEARKTLESDIAKACHHGSADFTDLFLKAINASGTIISSGDNEPYSHPRPDTLGALGKYGRGQRPLIFSTELARSANENIKDPYLLRERIKELNKKILEAETEKERKSLQKLLDKEIEKLERSIAVYGMISLRTDGKKVIIAQKLEKQRSKDSKWDIHQFELGPDNRLYYI